MKRAAALLRRGAPRLDEPRGGKYFPPATATESGCSSVVERQLPKLNVAGSIPATRSTYDLGRQAEPGAFPHIFPPSSEKHTAGSLAGSPRGHRQPVCPLRVRARELQ